MAAENGGGGNDGGRPVVRVTRTTRRSWSLKRASGASLCEVDELGGKVVVLFSGLRQNGQNELTAEECAALGRVLLEAGGVAP